MVIMMSSSRALGLRALRCPLRAVLPASRAVTRSFSTHTNDSRNNNNNVTYRPRRGLLYMPGSSLKMLSKIPTLGADSICCDLEDAVAPNKKVEARNNIVQTLNNTDFGRSERCVRINPVDSSYASDDIHHILSSHTKVLPHTIVLPKVETAMHIHWLHSRITQLTRDRPDRDAGANIKIIALIESARALVNLQSIAESCPERLTAFIFGADDYAADVGAQRTIKSQEVEFARNYILLHAKAAGLQAIDMVNIHFKDKTELLQRECEYGAQLGYTGKQLIHPAQISIAHQAFAPSQERIEWAQQIVAADEKYAEEGVGAFELDGKMIDAPTVKQARKVVALAKACELV